MFADDAEEKLMRATEIGCRTLSVLHLSDLHISGAVLSEKYYNLIKDVEEQCRPLKNIVIVVTGDIASHGQILKSQDAILNFFQELKAVLSCKVVDIQLVPGNHDISRDYLFSIDNYEVALKDYLTLANRIVSIFGVKHSFKSAYGVSVVDCGGRSICFMRADTSWFLEGRQFETYIQSHYMKSQMERSAIEHQLQLIRDSKNARVREYIVEQIANLVDELNVKRSSAKKIGSPVELVVALAHHPLSWLMKSNRESYMDFLNNHSAPDVDVWICGHAHNVKIHYDNDDNQSMVVLMSGVGSEEQRRSVHRYSLYHLSLTRNVCSVRVRASYSKGTFKDDDSLLPTETSHQTGHFCYPLKAKSPGSIIQLNTFEGNPAMEFYADQHALSMMRSLMEKMLNLGKKLIRTTELQTEFFKMNFVKQTRGEKFVNYLSRVCDDISSALKLESAENSELVGMPLFAEGADVCRTYWRAHFRMMLDRTGKEDIYRCIAYSGGTAELQGTEEASGMQDVRWGSLIMAAASHAGKSLIRSANPTPAPNTTRWDDYMTTIPAICGNSVKIKGEDRPIITFGLSAKSANYESSVVACRFLYLLEFFNINKMISAWIKEFIDQTGFSLDELFQKERSNG